MKTLRNLVLASLTAVVSSTVAAQVPAPELAKPPANARHFIIQSTGGKHGDSWSWVTVDGTRLGRESMNLRGQVFELDSRGTAGPDGLPSTVTIRGVTPQGDASETFTISDREARWKSPVDGGTANYSAPAFYLAQGGPIDTTAWLLEALLARPDKTLNLLPGGKAQAARLTDLEVGGGAARQTITLWAVTGVSNSPLAIWADANNRFFGVALGLAWLPEEYAGEQLKIEDAQAKAMAAQAPALARALARVPAGPVVFTNVRLFDADGARFLPDRTVIVDRGIISAVGAATSVTVPSGADVIDGRGKTLVPVCGTVTCTSVTILRGCKSSRWALRRSAIRATTTCARWTGERAQRRVPLVAARVPIVAHRWQGTVHGAGRQRCCESGRSDRAC